MLSGISVSGGIGIGRVLKFTEKAPEYEERIVSDVQAEKRRFESAVKKFCQKTAAAAKKIDESGSCGDILRGHIALIEDPYILSSVNEAIEEGKCAEKAAELVCEKFIDIFSSSEDELTRQRAADVEDIKNQILKILLNCKDVDLTKLPENTVLAAHELSPSVMASIDFGHISAIVTENGGKTSHAAIILRSIKIPAVMGVKDALRLIPDECEVIIDAQSGNVICNAGEETRNKYIRQRELYLKKAEALQALYGKTTRTADGERKEVFANIGSPKDIDAVIAGDAEGVGLFRTEFLFMDRSSMPDEEEQFEAYKAVACAMKDKEVIIRTLDAGADKKIPYLGMGKEENPFMGFRAIRYCLKNSQIYKIQLRAILRASAYGNISVMIPLVTSAGEVLEVRRLVETIKSELESKGILYKKDIKIGVMIETPAACICADMLAECSDFFSIGTNDLIGYIMAADRGNADVEYLYSAFSPAVLRALRHVISIAANKGIKCGMCGEAAADERLTPLLLSFGLDEFSVSPSAVLSVRASISRLTKERCDRIADEVMSMKSAAEIERYLTDINCKTDCN